jgi:transposase-like protein
MKKFNVFLLAVFVIITSIIFTSCQLAIHNSNDYCPYCHSTSVTRTEKKIYYGPSSWEFSFEYKCDNCKKTYGVIVL